MKTAHQLVDEIALEVRPPKGVAIELHERSGSPNWVAGVPPMAVALADKFSAKIAALRKSHPIIDWSAAPSGRVAKSLSEVQRLVAKQVDHWTLTDIKRPSLRIIIFLLFWIGLILLAVPAVIAFVQVTILPVRHLFT